MKLWVDAVQPAPNDTEYAWIRSLDMAIFSVTLNERKGCPYEGIDIGHIIGTWENIGGVEFLEWLEETGRNYPICVHNPDSFEKEHMEEVVRRNVWRALDPAQAQHISSIGDRLSEAQERAVATDSRGIGKTMNYGL